MRFLLGQREAILAVAHGRWSVPVGGLFVFAAALARNYDGVSLREEPWHLLIPFVASAAAATLLHGILFLSSWLRGQRPTGFWRGWYRFLGLFWMTAPMALLYGIPYERMLPEVAALQANLATLALVATWRVLLMSRIVNVVWSWGMTGSAIATMFFADVVAVAALSQIRFPVLHFMGGIRYSESEALMAEVAFLVNAVAWLMLLPLFICFLALLSNRRDARPLLGAGPLTGGPRGTVIAFGGLVCLVWIPGLCLCQGEQQLRHRVEQLMLQGDFVEAFRLMTQHGQQGFPPHWNPPPRVDLVSNPNPLDRALVALASMDPPAAEWVEREMARKTNLTRGAFQIGLLSPNEFELYLAWLNRVPEGPEIAARHLNDPGYFPDDPEAARRSKEMQARLVRLITDRGLDPEELQRQMF